MAQVLNRIKFENANHNICQIKYKNAFTKMNATKHKGVLHYFTYY